MTGSTPFHVPRPGAALIEEARAARQAIQHNEHSAQRAGGAGDGSCSRHPPPAETSPDLTVPEPAPRPQIIAREASRSMTPTHRRATMGPDTLA